MDIAGIEVGRDYAVMASSGAIKRRTIVSLDDEPGHVRILRPGGVGVGEKAPATGVLRPWEAQTALKRQLPAAVKELRELAGEAAIEGLRVDPRVSKATVCVTLTPQAAVQLAALMRRGIDAAPASDLAAIFT